LEQEIQFRVNEAYIRIREREKTVSLAKTALADSEEALRLVRTRYENSLAPMVDLLDTQLMLDNARVRLIEAENEYMNSIVDLITRADPLKTLMAD
jgi:outer membrane protein TolC